MKLTSFATCIVLVLLLGVDIFAASSREEKEAKFAAEVKAAIMKLGTGPSARVELKLRDKRKLKGYVQQTDEDHFVVIDDRTGSATEVAYPQVKQVKGNNFSTGAKIAVAVVLIGILFAIAGASGP